MSTRQSVEVEIRALRERGEHAAASERVLSEYGGEVLRFLMSRAADAQLASDAFATFSEDLCRGLPRFEFRSSVRTWVYTLAYHALSRTRRALGRDRARHVALPEDSEAALASGFAHRTRTETPAYQRSEVKTRMLALRQSLPEEDQTLLELRTARRFAWKEIAQIHLGAATDAATLDKEAARLRKRHQLLVERLRELAKAEGLIAE